MVPRSRLDAKARMTYGNECAAEKYNKQELQ
jgi:hypothetical protein